MGEEEFSRIVQETWKDPKFLQEARLQRHLIWKLKCLKMGIKRWSKQFKKRITQKLDVLEE
jgi:hypothetical protein